MQFFYSLLDRCGNKVERCAEIMRDICEEHKLGICSLLQFLGHVKQLSVLLYQLVLLFIEFLV